MGSAERDARPRLGSRRRARDLACKERRAALRQRRWRVTVSTHLKSSTQWGVTIWTPTSQRARAGPGPDRPRSKQARPVEGSSFSAVMIVPGNVPENVERTQRCCLRSSGALVCRMCRKHQVSGGRFTKKNVSETKHVRTLYPIRQFNPLMDLTISINFPERDGNILEHLSRT